MGRDFRPATLFSRLRQWGPHLGFLQVIAFFVLTPHPGPLPVGRGEGDAAWTFDSLSPSEGGRVGVRGERCVA